MIEEADRRLSGWVADVVGEGFTVTLDPPTNSGTGAGVSIFLLDLAALPPLRGERRAPLQMALNYLVTVWAGTAADQHRLLDRLVTAAMQVEDFEVRLGAPPADLWTALAATPRPCFQLRVPVRQPLPEPAVELVREPLVVHGVQLHQLAGVVLGPG